MMTWTNDTQTAELIETQATAEVMVRLAQQRLQTVSPLVKTPLRRRAYNALRRWYWLRRWQRGEVRFTLHNYMDSTGK